MDSAVTSENSEMRNDNALKEAHSLSPVARARRQRVYVQMRS